MVRCKARSWFNVTICLSILLLLCACDPPGKPKQELSREQVVDFKTLYGTNCAGCHGENGRNGPGRILNDPLYLAVLPRDVMQGIIEKGRLLLAWLLLTLFTGRRVAVQATSRLRGAIGLLSPWHRLSIVWMSGYFSSRCRCVE
jgi:hypothetical protein